MPLALQEMNTNPGYHYALKSMVSRNLALQRPFPPLFISDVADHFNLLTSLTFCSRVGYVCISAPVFARWSTGSFLHNTNLFPRLYPNFQPDMVH